MSDNFKNILIIKPSSLGDIVQALPALSALRRSFPAAKISWLIRPEFAPLIENHPHLNSIIPFDRKFLGKAWYNWRAFASLLSLISNLRRLKFDAVIDLQGLFRSASLAWLSGSKKRFGMTTARELAGIFYTHKTPHDKDCIHVVDYYLKIVENTGACDTAVQFLVPKDTAAEDSVENLLTDRGIGVENYVVFVPCSAHRDKCWAAEKFAALADKISSRFGFSIVATGTKSETEDVEKINSLCDTSISNLAGLTNLTELVALLRTARLVVSNDTGPGHIAAALGTPLVLIFGWSNPARIVPYGRSQCAVAEALNTRGVKRKSTDPAHDVNVITLDHVFKKVCEQINS